MAMLRDRAALVTGSTGGLGVAIAHALARAGAFVIVSGRDEERGERVAADIRSRGGGATFISADLAGGPVAARELAQRSSNAAGGKVDVLVNNAATLLMPSPTADVSDGELRDSFGVNVFAPFLLTAALAPGMVERGGGAIINVGSAAGLRGSAGGALYSAHKAAIHSLTQSWADEYAASGVRVNAVAPGPISTPRALQFADYVKPMLARIPSRRASTPEEVAAAVLFLASDDAANVHGTVINVDGGWSAVLATS